MILCAIGGDDAYRLLPYLFENDQLQKGIKQKIFLGFSDTTMNHLMLHKLGIKTFYGQSFLADICELDKEMLAYSLHYFKELIETGRISEIRPSDVWYEERTDFSPTALGTPRVSHTNTGFDLLQGSAQFEGKILLLETSEEKPKPEDFKKMLLTLKDTGIFAVINGLLVGKPMDETFHDDYKEALLDIIDSNIPIVYNLNVGHATPRAIVPFGVHAHVDAQEQVILFDYNK